MNDVDFRMDLVDERFVPATGDFLPSPAMPPATPLLADLPAALASLVQAWDRRRDIAREAMTSRPLETLLALVAGAAGVYYLAERGRNDKVNTYWDALEFIGTSASVGCSNIFPATPVGKLMATTLFLIGPTLAARALDGTEK